MKPNTKQIASIWTAPRRPGQSAYIGGHRGASSEAGENSEGAFERAIAAGADFIELDWRLTRDGVPVAFHDETLARLHGDARRISAIDLQELQAIDPSIMKISDVLALAADRMCLLLDTKITDLQALGQGLELLAPDLRDDTVAFGTRTLAASRLVRERLPESPVLGLFAGYVDYPGLHAMGGRWARLWENDASREAIGGLQAVGLNVIVMAGTPVAAGVGEITASAMTEMLHRRPDAVMLNDVGLGLGARETHGALDASKPKSPGS